MEYDKPQSETVKSAINRNNTIFQCRNPIYTISIFRYIVVYLLSFCNMHFILKFYIGTYL